MSCEQPHHLLRSLLCPGILTAETWDDPGWMLLPSMSPRITANQHSWLKADEHLSMHLSALQRMRPWSRTLISKYSTRGRHCCMASQAACLQVARSMARNMASPLGTDTNVWRCLYLSPCKGRQADSAKWLAACQLHKPIWTVFFLYILISLVLLPLAWGLHSSWWHIEYITVFKSQ